MKTLRISFLAGLVLMLLISVPAQAALQIDYRVDGGALMNLATDPSGLITVGGGVLGANIFDIFATAKSDTPGEAIDAELLGSTLSLTNITGATHRLELFFSATGFTGPTAPPAPGLVFDSELKINVPHFVAGGSVRFQSCIDQGAVQHGCPGSPIQSTMLTAPIGSTGIAFDDDGTLTSLAGPYSISQYIDITLAGGEQILTINDTVLSAVPEPVSIALLGGLLLLTSGMIRRRAKGGTTV